MLELSSSSKDLHHEVIPTKNFDNNGLLKQVQDVYSIISNLNFNLLSTSDQSIIEALSTRVQDMKGALIDVKLRSEVKNSIFTETNIWDHEIAGLYINHDSDAVESTIQTCDLNRSMSFFCNSNTCIKMRECTNSGICENPNTLHVFQDGTSGLGLKTSVTISMGSHVVEYVGKIITGETQPDGPYMMHGIDSVNVNGAIQKFTINAETFGNKSRFCQHSCDPNMQATMYYDSSGKPHVMLDSIRIITAGEALTFTYSVLPCKCECPYCRLVAAVDFMNESDSVTHDEVMEPVVPAVSVSVMTDSESKSHVKESVADLEGLLIHVYFVCFHYLIG